MNVDQETTAESAANRQMARGALVVMAAFVLSNLVGLVRQMLITNAFGTSADLDAFYAAEKLPNILFTLVAGGALASAFIPNFTTLLEKGDRKGAWKLASNIFNLVTITLTVISLLGAIGAEWIVGGILAPKFPLEQQLLTASLLRILLLTTVIFGASGLLMGILNAHQQFLLPALAPTMYWLGMIFGVLFLAPRWGIYGLAWGAVVGAALHFLVQAPGLLRAAGRAYTASLGLQDKIVRRVGRLMAPRLLGVAVVQLNFLVNVMVASGLPTGSYTAIVVAFQVMTMPQVVIAQAIAIAALPMFSAQVAGGRLGEMRRSLSGTLRSILLLAVPASAGLVLLRTPITAMLFQRGEFGMGSTEMVAWALLWYALGLVSHSVVEIVSRAFYALHNTKTPVAVGAGAMSLNVVLSFTLPGWFENLGWMPLGGLALANTIATTLEMITLIALIRPPLGGLEGKSLWSGTLQAGFGTLAMSIAVLIWSGVFATGPAWQQALGGIGIGGVVYGVMAIALRVPEAKTLIEMGIGKLGLKGS